MLNLFQYLPLFCHAELVSASNKKTLKQVQGDSMEEKYPRNVCEGVYKNRLSYFSSVKPIMRSAQSGAKYDFCKTLAISVLLRPERCSSDLMYSPDVSPDKSL